MTPKEEFPPAEWITLTPLVPDSVRAARTRQRCRATLDRHARRKARSAQLRSVTIDAVAAAIVAGCGLLFAAVLLANTLRVEGLLD